MWKENYMAYKILETDPIHNTHKFFVDDIEDLETLPIESASSALVANTGDTYICNNNSQWVMYIDNPIGDGGSGGGAQSYPLTVGEGSKFTVKFIDPSGNEITEAPAGTIVQIDCESMGGDSGILICTDQDGNTSVCEKNGELGNYDIHTAVPIGGLKATVYVN